MSRITGRKVTQKMYKSLKRLTSHIVDSDKGSRSRVHDPEQQGRCKRIFSSIVVT